VTLHQCRHGFDSFLEAAGISEARADRYMGHAQNSVSDRYRHRLRGQLLEDARRLDEYLRRDAADVLPLPTGTQDALAASLSGTGMSLQNRRFQVEWETPVEPRPTSSQP
jgi:hypothetical protein